MMIVYCLWRSLHLLISKKESAPGLVDLKKKLKKHMAMQEKEVIFLQDRRIRGNQDKKFPSLQEKLLGEREYVYPACSLL